MLSNSRVNKYLFDFTFLMISHVTNSFLLCSFSLACFFIIFFVFLVIAYTLIKHLLDIDICRISYTIIPKSIDVYHLSTITYIRFLCSDEYDHDIPYSRLNHLGQSPSSHILPFPFRSRETVLRPARQHDRETEEVRGL